jgi:serine/threonine protein kinase
MSNKIFGKYEILEEIGRGGMGVVYRARHREIGKVVALKLLQTSGPDLEPQVRMFKREIESMAKLNHPNLIGIHDVGETGGQHYFTMDYIDGCTLDELMTGMGEAQKSGSSSIREIVEYVQHQKSSMPGWTSARYGSQVETVVDEAGGKKTEAPSPVNTGVRRVGRFRALNEARAVAIAAKTLRALAHAHERGVLHRDIKPSNIMVTKDGEPVLMDFGLARELDSRQSMQLTRSGQVMGTVSYMSPEQAAGRKDEVRERSDVYSAGAVLYEMLTGRPPFIPAGNLVADLRAVIEKDPAPVRRINPTVPQELAVICQKAMEKDAERRYRTAWAYAEDLQRYINGEPILARPQGLVYRLRKKILRHKAVSLSAAVLFLVFSGALIYWFQTTKTIRQKEQELAAEKAKSQSRWILAYENDFNSNVLDSANWYFRNPLGTNTLRYGVENGRLVLRNNGSLFSNKRVNGNIRIEFDAVVDSSEILVKILCDSTYAGNNRFYRINWSDETVKWQRGHTNDWFFSKRTRLINLDRRAGQVIRNRVEYEDGTCRYWVDDSLVLEAWDFHLFSGTENNRWAFQCVSGRVFFDNLRVFRQILPLRMDVTRQADIYVEHGDYAKAARALYDIIENYNDSLTLQRALCQILNLRFQKKYTAAADPLLGLDSTAFKHLVDRIFRIGDIRIKRLFFLVLYNKVEESGRFGFFRTAAQSFANTLDTHDRFLLYVFLGLMMRDQGRIEQANEYFRSALSVREDGLVRGYLEGRFSGGHVPPRGSMKFVPAGYLLSGMQQFGLCTPVHAFWMDSVEVTRAFYRRITGMGDAGRVPAAHVNWYDAVNFCNKRSLLAGLEPCYAVSRPRDYTWDRYDSRLQKYVTSVEQVYSVECDFGKNGFRLPTVMEFSYATKGLRFASYPWEGNAKAAGRYVWFQGNSGNSAHPVGQKRPNAFGLYDITGNVNEWCWELQDPDMVYRVIAGGDYSDPLNQLEGVNKKYAVPFEKNPFLGFRCVRNPG